MAGSIIVGIVTKPLRVLKWACLFGLRTAFILCITWTELVKANISFHFTLIWKMIVWTLALLSLPFRLLTAISRESQVPSTSLFSSASYYVSSLTPFHVFFVFVCFPSNFAFPLTWVTQYYIWTIVLIFLRGDDWESLTCYP